MTRRAVTAPEWQKRLAAAGLDDPLMLLERSPEHLPGRWEALVKPGLGGRERWRWELPGDPPTVLYVKRYLHTPPREQFDRMWRQGRRCSRAWWEWLQSQRLSEKHLSVVRTVACAEQMRGWREVYSAAVFEAVPGDALDRTWTRLSQDRAPVTQAPLRHAVNRHLARYVSALHQSGTCHRDLYLCHVFVELDPNGSHPPQFTLIDLGRTHQPRARRTRWIIKDLSQLDCSARQIGATRADRLRFLAAYLSLPTKRPRLRWYARRVVRKSDRILRRIARKNGAS